MSRSTVLRYKRDRAQPGNIFTGQKSAWVRSRATDNRSDPTMFVHPACLQRSAAAAERLSTFDNRRIYRSICRSPLEFAVAHDSRNRARGKRIEGEQRCLKREREREKKSISDNAMERCTRVGVPIPLHLSLRCFIRRYLSTDTPGHVFATLNQTQGQELPLGEETGKFLSA